MHNLTYLIGRISSDLEITELENGSKKMSFTLEVNRSFKNEEGIYESDFIPVSFLNSIAEHTKEYCNKGDLVGLRGRLETTGNKIEVIADKVSFLSSRKVEDGEME